MGKQVIPVPEAGGVFLQEMTKPQGYSAKCHETQCSKGAPWGGGGGSCRSPPAPPECPTEMPRLRPWASFL